MYTRNLKAHRGTDNRILFEFVNQDQKPVDVIGIEFTFRMISGNGETLLLEKPLEIVNKGKGQARVVLTEQELDGISPGLKGFSIEQQYVPFAWTPIEPPIDPEDPVAIQPIYPPIPNCSGPYNPTGPTDPVDPDSFQKVEFEATYVDDHGGGRGVIEVLDSIMPAFVVSNILTIPDRSGLNNEYNSSIINTDAQAIHTFQLTVDSFTGTITFQGGSDTDNEWYEIVTSNYTNHNGIIGANIDGFHPYLRVNITDNTAGEITKIIYR
ncbi:MAG: hypothetical protein DRN27_10145 [Thermoplasmata archaeon]|nr:MAG: hypothetical protein DRN27_10145 [Thermoplasmata archaeon]